MPPRKRQFHRSLQWRQLVQYIGRRPGEMPDVIGTQGYVSVRKTSLNRPRWSPGRSKCGSPAAVGRGRCIENFFGMGSVFFCTPRDSGAAPGRDRPVPPWRRTGDAGRGRICSSTRHPGRPRRCREPAGRRRPGFERCALEFRTGLAGRDISRRDWPTSAASGFGGPSLGFDFGKVMHLAPIDSRAAIGRAGPGLGAGKIDRPERPRAALRRPGLVDRATF